MLPYLLPIRDEGQHVQGEVYRVSPNCLRGLDELEGHPHWYRRKEINIILTSKKPDQDPHIQAWAYFYQNWGPHQLQLPFLACYKPGGHSAPLSEL